MKITFILPFVNLTGGIKILFEHANRLIERGHRVTVVYPGVLFHGDHFEIKNNRLRWRLVEIPIRQLKYWFFVSLLRKTEADWFPLDRRLVLKRTPDLSVRYIPNADLAIATAPETVPWVATYPALKGIKVHFSQDYESWYLPEKFLANIFSERQFHLITIGQWQKRLYQEKFGRKVEMVIPDGVDTTRFHPKARARKKGAVRILMVYHHLPYKGIGDGFFAYNQAKAAGLPVQLVMFGVHPLKDGVPADVEYRRNVAEEKLPDLYQSCDIFLWPTHREGFGLPPMEAMACGLPVVGTDAGAMPDFMKDGVAGYMVGIKQPKKLAEKLIKLVADERLRTKMGQAAAKAMKQWDWEQQTDKLEQYLNSLVDRR